MLYVSRFVSDRDRDPELWATIWQAKAPPTLNLIGAYNLGGDERVFIWEGDTVADLQFMDSFNDVGRLDTSPAFDRTVGWQNAFTGNIEAFGGTCAPVHLGPKNRSMRHWTSGVADSARQHRMPPEGAHASAQPSERKWTPANRSPRREAPDFWARADREKSGRTA
jgi:hypothetical protein